MSGRLQQLGATLKQRRKRIIACLAVALAAVAGFSVAAYAENSSTPVSCIGSTVDGDGHFTLDCTVPMPSPSTVTVTTPVPVPTTVTSTVTTTVTVTPSPTTSTPPPTTTPPGACPVATPHVPGGPDDAGGCWPGPGNTGVPAGTNLTTYSSPCIITTANTTITARLVTCSTLTIRATGVVITRSEIRGRVLVDTGSVTITDSLINLAARGTVQETVIEDHGYTLERVELRGGYRGAWCNACTIRDSWVHGQLITGNWHAGGVRMDQNATLVHNSLACDALSTPQDGGCSAPLTGYGDFAPVRNNLIEHNLFVAPPDASYCAYGGSSGDKPYSNQAANIRFINNIFQRGTSGHCGIYAAVGDWRPSAPGAVFTGNTYPDGAPVHVDTV